MEYAKPEKFRARVSEKYYLTENEKFLYVKFELIKPDRFEFRAGQYVSLRLGESSERRSYSIATTPDVKHGFSITAEIILGGKGSEFLKQMEIGAEAEVLAPLGRFVIHEASEKILFVATGSGIVPIYAMINDLLINQHERRQMRLHWGLKDESNVFWFDNLERLMEQNPNFVFDPVLSQPSADWSLCSGHVQDCLTRDFREEKLEEWQGYICGNPKMVEEVSLLLKDLGMKSELINHEKFV